MYDWKKMTAETLYSTCQRAQKVVCFAQAVETASGFDA